MQPESVPRVRSLSEGPGPGDLKVAIMGYDPPEHVAVSTTDPRVRHLGSVVILLVLPWLR